MTDYLIVSYPDRASAATPEANNQRQLDFDNYGSPVDEGNEFLSLPTPSPQDMSRVWHNGSPSSQNFVIWEDPEGQPEPVSSTPEPTSDMDEDKENLFIRLPGDQTAQEVAQHTFSDRIDAQMGPLDAFGMPLQTHFDPDLTVRPHRNPRTSPDARIANPGTPLANRTFRPTTPTIIREGGAGTEDDFWTRNLFQAQPDQTARQANLFYRELRRRRGRGFVFRTDDNDWDEDDEQTETQDTIEFRRRRDRARDSEDDV